MTIVLIVEGETERAFKTALKRFVDERSERERKARVGIRTRKMDGSFRENDRLLRDIADPALADEDVSAVVALTDVYPDFRDAAEAKRLVKSVFPDDPRFHAHAAVHEFEAWLLPYWDDICRRLRRRQRPPGQNPERVDRNKPPSRHLEELYRLAGWKYIKRRDGPAILRDKDLGVAAAQCPELKALLNTVLEAAGLERL